MGAKMAAGDGAAEQSRLAAERAAKLRRQLDQAERAERAWAAGAAGEARVADVLDELEPQGWRVLHDVRWPGRPKANLDHVLVGPGGVIVIDAKNWSGEVQLRNGTLRQNRYSREREVSGVLEQCSAVAALLEPQHRRHVQAWLCMVGQATMHGITASGARIQGLDTLRNAIGALPAVLDLVTVEIIHTYLRELLSGGTSPTLLTTRQLDIGTPDLARDALPAASLATWRSARHASDSVVQVPTGRKPKRRKTKSCLGALLYIASIIFILGVLVNVMSHLSQPAPQAPRPTPSVVKTVPSR